MPEHQPFTIERRCDVAIIGGSAAGLAAALQLSRQRRSVIVVDDNRPRNAPAAHMHGFLGHEGISPMTFGEISREEVRSYGVEVLAGQAHDVTRVDDEHVRIDLGGLSVLTRRVLAATGIVDELPAIEGLAEHWGRDVIHCPFCHGYEVRDKRVLQIITHPMGVHSARLFHQLTYQLTLVLHDGVDPSLPDLGPLRAAGVNVMETSVRRVLGDHDGRLTGVELHDGSLIEVDAVAVGPSFRPRIEPFGTLGLTATPHPSGLGDVIATEPSGKTTVPGLYAAGNVCDPSMQVLQAAANGSWVGAMMSLDLADEDLGTTPRPKARTSEWDNRYDGDQMWSGEPNGALVAEVSALTPGRALDVGAGEGGDAVWLAERGWQVTANDISRRALDRVEQAAASRGVTVELLCADANDPHPFPTARFDLVTAHYASIPRTPDERALLHLLDAVAPGGTLLFVTHDPEPMRATAGVGHVRPFDPDAYVRAEDMINLLEATTGRDNEEWTIVTNERRPRPAGAATASHHVDDVVLRVQRGRSDGASGNGKDALAI